MHATAVDSPTSIARLVTVLAAVAGLGAALYYANLDLTLSHYDARGHLVVARRTIDGLTPGWRQIGAVWLPLPHLLNALPVQWDWSYRTGWSGIALSVGFLSAGLGALAGWLWRSTSSWAIAVAVPLVILLNPNVLYLQSTPMTEPLLFGLSLAALASMDRWLKRPGPEQTLRTGAILAALMLTRYEGWFIAAALVAVGAVVSIPRAARLAMYPATAVAAFLLLSWGSTGQWFVTSGFFEANNPALGDLALALGQVAEGVTELGGPWLLWFGLAGTIALVVAAGQAAMARSREGVTRALVPLTLAAAAALPAYAFFSGHPVRIRYMTALIVAAPVIGAFALARLPRRLHTASAALLLAVAIWVTPPLDDAAPVVREAQRERPTSDARQTVTAALTQVWDGTPIMASMGSLGHYMQQLAAHGFDLRDFLHEGNGDLWTAALAAPRPYVKWMLIEESAEGGDTLAALARANPAFLAGFTRAAHGGGVVLYVRTESGSRP
ncbi:MAG: hypothetical protein EXQ49_10240 [Acidobacteria bacterium]|nr:hypothetical protein [Acidobacteriota bacterium]